MTSENRTTKRPPQEERERTSAERQPRRDQPERKPAPSDALEWRGSGVCGDRQTD